MSKQNKPKYAKCNDFDKKDIDKPENQSHNDCDTNYRRLNERIYEQDINLSEDIRCFYRFTCICIAFSILAIIAAINMEFHYARGHTQLKKELESQKNYFESYIQFNNLKNQTEKCKMITIVFNSFGYGVEKVDDIDCDFEKLILTPKDYEKVKVCNSSGCFLWSPKKSEDVKKKECVCRDVVYKNGAVSFEEFLCPCNEVEKEAEKVFSTRCNMTIITFDEKGGYNTVKDVDCDFEKLDITPKENEEIKLCNATGCILLTPKEADIQQKEQETDAQPGKCASLKGFDNSAQKPFFCEFLNNPTGHTERVVKKWYPRAPYIDGVGQNRECVTRREKWSYNIIESKFYWEDEIQYACCCQAKEKNCEDLLFKIEDPC